MVLWPYHSCPLLIPSKLDRPLKTLGLQVLLTLITTNYLTLTHPLLPLFGVRGPSNTSCATLVVVSRCQPLCIVGLCPPVVDTGRSLLLKLAPVVVTGRAAGMLTEVVPALLAVVQWSLPAAVTTRLANAPSTK